MKKFEFPPDLDFRYRIQPPSGRHKVFRVIKVLKPSGTETIQSPEVESVNAALLKGRLNREQAKKELDLLVERLYREAGVRAFKAVSNSDNINVLGQFWADVYKKRRIVDRDSAFAKFRRAVESVGEHSLRTASEDEIQQAIDSKYRGNKQRAVVGRLHSILKWLKRGDVNLVLEPEVEEEVRYLSADELELVLGFIDLGESAVTKRFTLMARVARATGARIGELLVFQPSKDKKTVFIKHQLRRDGIQALAKAKRADSPGRVAYVLPEGRMLLNDWLKERGGITKEVRLNAANIIKAAAKRAFPNVPQKWVKFHDLRHSYAIELAQSGVSLLNISQQLGNSERVCQKHYTGYMSTNETADMIEAKVLASKRSG
jgi:integrase